MIQQKHIQIPVIIDIKKRGLSTRSKTIKTINGCHLKKSHFSRGRNSLINKQLICPFFRRQITRITNINIEPPIAINIHHGRSRFPWAFATRYSGRRGNILKRKISFIQIKLIAMHITGKIYIIQPIIIYITHCNTAAIIKIFIH